MRDVPHNFGSGISNSGVSASAFDRWLHLLESSGNGSQNERERKTR